MSSKNVSNTYKIIFDTNIIWLDNEDKISKIFNSSIKESLNFIKENEINQNVFLAIPEIVVEERIAQVIEQTNVILKKVENGLISLKDFGVNIKENRYKRNFSLKIKQNTYKILKDSKIEIIAIPKIDQKKIVKRAINKIKPFSDRGDKGFKDTLIWLTILNDARKSKDIHYILCTNNFADFDCRELREEFSKISNGNLYIITDLKALKQLLDQELNLELKLKELHKSIEDEIKQKVGELMVQFNAQINQEGTSYGTTASFISRTCSYAPRTMGSLWGIGQEDKIVGYDFEGLDVTDIFELNVGVYEVRGKLVVLPRKSSEKRYEILAVDHLNILSTPMIYSVIFKYDQNSRQLYLTTIHNPSSI